MNNNEILKQQKVIYNSLITYQLNNSIKAIEDLQEQTAIMHFSTELDNIKLEYHYLLSYFKNGTNDPQREIIFSSFIQRLFVIADKIISEYRTRNDVNLYYSHKRNKIKNGRTLSILLNEYKKEVSKLNLFDLNDYTSTIEIYKTTEILEFDIFNYIWTIFPAYTDDIYIINEIFENNTYPTYFKELIISAVMMSLFEYYDERLFLILVKFYNNDNPNISLKSLISVVLIAILHKERILISNQFKNIFDLISDNAQFSNDIKNIIYQFIRSWNTERITKKMEDEILPNLIKISPNFIKKFRHDSTLTEISDFESNPEWKNTFENDDLTKKIEEFNKLQSDGGDVFAGTFSHLKSFPFFSKISNWFLPFHQNHSLIRNTLQEDEIKLFSIMLDSKFLCDSDKFSFLASLGLVPESQRKVMLMQLEEQNNAINELKTTELQVENKITRQSIISNYLQNLYRFFKFYPQKKEFRDPFKDLLNLDIIKLIVHTELIDDTLILIGEYCLQNNLYTEAIYYLNSIRETYKNTQPTLYQKIGFCYQSLSRYSEAIEEYEKFDLLENKDLWTLKHLAVCYKGLKHTDEALKCYLKIKEFNPENINILLNIGHCYLDLCEYDNALKYYYKVHYLDETASKALRPLAWCLFLMKDFTTSESFYTKIISSNPNATDYLNYGHLKLGQQEIKKAIEFYQLSIDENGTIEKFIESFKNDFDVLYKVGISKYDIQILLDILVSK